MADISLTQRVKIAWNCKYVGGYAGGCGIDFPILLDAVGIRVVGCTLGKVLTDDNLADADTKQLLWDRFLMLNFNYGLLIQEAGLGKIKLTANVFQKFLDSRGPDEIAILERLWKTRPWVRNSDGLSLLGIVRSAPPMPRHLPKL